jgi:hypothetical protein
MSANKTFSKKDIEKLVEYFELLIKIDRKSSKKLEKSKTNI